MLTAIDEFNFHRTLADSPGTSLVIFTSPGCGACRAWKQILNEYRERNNDVRMFEVDAADALALTREFDVFHLPALFLYRDGRFHAALQAEAQVDKLHAALVGALSAPPEDAP
jgi:thioredoxin 1